MDNPPIPSRDYSQADGHITEVFKKFGLSVFPTVNIPSGEIAPPDEQYRNYDISGTRWGIIIDAAGAVPTRVAGDLTTVYEMALYHDSQMEESDPTPILETWSPAVIAYIVADAVELETFLDMPPPDDDSEED